MYFSRIEPNLSQMNASQVSNLVNSNAYSLHQVVWQLFAARNIVERDFIFRHEDKQGVPLFYSVSRREPVDPQGCWIVKTKNYCPQIRRDALLEFMLRANPVVTRRVGEEKRHTRHDVVMDKKSQLRTQGVLRNEWPDSAELVHQEGLKWLNSRAEAYGFVCDDTATKAYGYRLNKLMKRKTTSAIQFSTIDFKGVLSVTDPEIFQKTLYEGLGAAKALGCGMLMVRRI